MDLLQIRGPGLHICGNGFLVPKCSWELVNVSKIFPLANAEVQLLLQVLKPLLFLLKARNSKVGQAKLKSENRPKVEDAQRKQQGITSAAVGPGLVFYFILIFLLKYKTCLQGMSPHTQVVVGGTWWQHGGHCSLERGVGTKWGEDSADQECWSQWCLKF